MCTYSTDRYLNQYYKIVIPRLLGPSNFDACFISSTENKVRHPFSVLISLTLSIEYPLKFLSQGARLQFKLVNPVIKGSVPRYDWFCEAKCVLHTMFQATEPPVMNEAIASELLTPLVTMDHIPVDVSFKSVALQQVDVKLLPLSLLSPKLDPVQ
ncbi:hypothetical protein GNI_008770 [Gregarina niphandrodes]|uniref:Uncharacterized protein n=1 Tax=Gregarina niphandrodes TaxID=110365 RepID=A0A023BCZ2_GRENI|nr:hypothetical protein GNI_008770 [Gregarina niphandrodes]EZG86971.1 hypothetical protein GNI_008770 [Gregarina niphandrodes]|eukprot:XP_011128727.1 hypothetical protein GNI_008770 [Gregarina niphandrodes]